MELPQSEVLDLINIPAHHHTLLHQKIRLKLASAHHHAFAEFGGRNTCIYFDIA